MSEVFKALGRGIAGLANARMLVTGIWPLAVAALLWGIIAALFGAQSVQWIKAYVSDSAVAQWTSQWFSVEPVVAVLGWLAIVLLFIPLVLMTASLIIGIFAMPAIVNHVAQQHYANLERKRGSGVVGMVANAFLALAIFLGLTLLSLPLWIVPLLWPILPVALLAVFNQRMFRYDALAEHASREEMQLLSQRYGAEMWLLAALLSLLAHIPILGFFAPVVAGLSFTHYGLARLQELRTSML